MVSLLFLVVVTLSLNWAKKCKGVNYKYKVFGGVQEYGYGCKKGCIGYYNGSDTDISWDGTKDVDDHTEQSECAECKIVTADKIKEYSSSISDEQATDYAKIVCSLGIAAFSGGGPGGGSGGSGNRNCHWKKGKCVASSCPIAAATAKCDESFGHEWKDGKCVRVKGDKCLSEGYLDGNSAYTQTSSGGYCSGPSIGGNCYAYVSDNVPCKDLETYYKLDWSAYTAEKFSANDVKECKYKCEHPEHTYYAGGPWDYTRDGRKECHKVYGCMYSGEHGCSALAIWAFILILVFAILVFLAIIGLIFFLIFKLCCGSKSTKVDPAPQTTTKSAAAPATQAAQVPLFEVGPYVVIKVAKQESKTKKVESAMWGQSITFSGMGPEDDDVVFELHDNNDALLGTGDVRIPDYVNTKKRATINLKNGEADIGVLEVDIEIQVQEEPEVKITGVFYVDKFAKV